MNLFILSDGMGGLARGEVASRLTVETVLAHCQEADADPLLDLIGKHVAGVNETSSRLTSGIHLANQIVYRSAQETATHQTMGATVVALRCVNNHLSIAHVGDSRAYRLRNDSFEQLTQDHSFVAEQLRSGRMSEEEANTSNLQNVLTRAVGIEPEIDVDVREELLMEGDTLLLCSDGLTRELSDGQIAGILSNATDAQEAADQLIHFANEAGGGDNITAIVIRHVREMRPGPRSIRRISQWFGGSRSQS
jgi:protein phosphatase